MKLKKSLLAASVFAALSFSASAQESNEPKLTVKPTGLLLLDAAAYGGNTHGLFKGGAGVPDVRIGVSAEYGKWKARIDVGYAYGKVGLKDIYMQYTFNERNFVRGGSFIYQYGLQSAYSSAMKSTMEEPTSNELFAPPRLLGVMYEHSGDKFLAAASAHLEPSSIILTPSQMGHQGYGLLARLAWRPLHEDGKVAQIGISGAFTSPYVNSDDYGNKHHTIELAGNFPTRVERVKALDVTVDHAMNSFKFTPELLLSSRRVALESQYFYTRVNRRLGLPGYTAYGAYGILRGLILGKGYSYDMLNGGLAAPAPRTLEAALEYNYTSLVDRKAGFFGGRVSGVSCTFNYYINKYMIARLRYGFTKRWDLPGTPDMDLSTIQARLQIAF